MHYKTEGLVIRKTKYKEQDELLTILTPEHGRVFARARRALGKSGRLSAACQLLTLSEFVFFSSKERLTIETAEIIEPFTQLRRDIEKLALASYMSELAGVLSDSDAGCAELYRIVLNSLHALCRLDKPHRQIKAAFELRALAAGGFMPRLDGCAGCGRQDGDFFLSTHSGLLHCPGCRARAGGTINLPLGRSALDAMRYVVSCDIKQMFAFSLGEPSLDSLSDVAEAYTLSQLERGFNSLDFYKGIAQSTDIMI